MKPAQGRMSSLFLGVVFIGAGWPAVSDAQLSVKDDMNRGEVILSAPSRPSKLLGIFWLEAPPSSGFASPTKAQSDEWVAKVLSWEEKVQDFNRRLGEALNARKADIRFIDYLQKKYKLDDCQRRYLHDLITNQELSEEEIEEVAHDISESGDHECPPGRGGRR